MTTLYNVQYNIPRFQVQLPGRQNRLTDGELRISPGMTEPIQFVFGNQDGVLLNLVPFRIQFVVWETDILSTKVLAGMGQSNVLINKLLLVTDPYSAEVEMILEERDTILLGNHAAGQALRWSLFLINQDDQVFPMQVSTYGGRYGTISIDLAGMLPVAELIRSATS